MTKVPSATEKPNHPTIDWAAVRSAYETTDAPLRAIATAHGIKSENSIRDRAKRKGWLRKPIAQGDAQVVQPTQVDSARMPEAKPWPKEGEVTTPQNRDAAGRFIEGNRANPGGRPAMMAEVVKAAREHTAEAIATLAQVMRDKKAAASAKVAAAEALLNRGWGKAPAIVALKDTDLEAKPALGGGRAKLQALIDGLVRESEFNAARECADETKASA